MHSAPTPQCQGSLPPAPHEPSSSSTAGPSVATYGGITPIPMSQKGKGVQELRLPPAIPKSRATKAPNDDSNNRESQAIKQLEQ
eukprot:2124089-Heterocapsa_arctica.AAC.2